MREHAKPPSPKNRTIQTLDMENYTPTPPTKLPEDLRTWAREMRGRMTDAEALLWQLLRNRRIAGAKFRRQHPVGRYILDFYCDEKKLGIELDGGQHTEAVDYDARRDAWLSMQEIRVLRFWNNQVLTETEAVMEAIYSELLSP
jgi:very-short-patch-repair endonuclease